MSDEETKPPDAEDLPPDSMEEVLAEALAEEEFSDAGLSDPGAPSVDEVDIRDALRAALIAPKDDISITREVQKKLREDPELEGRYFADGWSTATAPKETYLITSVVMLVVIIVIYFLIRPYGL